MGTQIEIFENVSEFGYLSTVPRRGGRRFIAVMRSDRIHCVDDAWRRVKRLRPDFQRRNFRWGVRFVDGDFGMPHPDRSIHRLIIREISRTPPRHRLRSMHGRIIKDFND